MTTVIDAVTLLQLNRLVIFNSSMPSSAGLREFAFMETRMEHVENLFKSGIEEIERLLTTKTVVGDPIVIEGKTLIPLVSVGFGFGAGGGTGGVPKKKDGKQLEGVGGGTGGGAGIKPVAVIVVDENGVRLDPIKGGTTSVLEKAFDTFACRGKKKEEEKQSDES